MITINGLDRQTDRQTGRQMVSRTDGLTDRQIDRQTDVKNLTRGPGESLRFMLKDGLFIHDIPIENGKKQEN